MLFWLTIKSSKWTITIYSHAEICADITYFWRVYTAVRNLGVDADPAAGGQHSIRRTNLRRPKRTRAGRDLIRFMAGGPNDRPAADCRSMVVHTVSSDGRVGRPRYRQRRNILQR